MKSHHINFSKLVLFYFIVNNIHAQHQHEVGLISDNDVYVSLYLDEFYTNGLELFYQYTPKTKSTLFYKKIRRFELEQNIYNPQSNDELLVYIQERPYAGYLALNYTERFINKKNIFDLGLTVGVTNDKSGAEWAQNLIHKLYSIELSDGWDTQVKEKSTVGIFSNYVYNIVKSNNSKLSLSWLNKGVFNSIFNNISSGLAFRISLINNALAPISNSSFFGTAIQTKDEKWIKETYIGVKSYATYQITDYTINGELEENPSKKEFHLEPWTWLNDIGIYWNLKNINLSYHLIYKTREATEMKTKITRYGSILFSYKF